MKKNLLIALSVLISAPAFAKTEVRAGSENFSKTTSFRGIIKNPKVYSLPSGGSTVSIAIIQGKDRVVINYSEADMPVGASLMASEGKDATVGLDDHGKIKVMIGKEE